MNVKLAYGKTGYSIELSDKYDIDIIEPLWVDSVKDQSLAITEALTNPYKSKSLKDIVKPTDKVAILFSDITRATPYNIILPPLLNELRNIPPGKYLFFLCERNT